MSALPQEPIESSTPLEESSKELLKSLSIPEHKGIFAFGEYRLDGQERQLWRGDSLLTLSPKAFDLLITLVKNAPRLVEKQYLLRTVWPDSFVEEANLTVYVSTLRKLFGDTPEGRSFIETVPKWGYRFTPSVANIHPTTVDKPDKPDKPDKSLQEEKRYSPPWLNDGDELGSENSIVDFEPRRAKGNLRFAGISVLIFCVLLIAIAIFRSTGSAKTPHLPTSSRPLTSLPGSFSHPAFSPDGQTIAYAWRGISENERSIYIQRVKSDERLRLTDTGADDFSPAWSPAGDQIAFLHSVDPAQPLELLVSNIHTMMQRKLASLTGGASSFRTAPTLAWSPDRKWILTTDRDALHQSSCLVLISVESGQEKILTHPPLRTGDSEGKFSPDGKFVAFTRSLGSSVDDIYLISTNGGEERRLTFQTHSTDGLVWDTDGLSIIVSTGRATSVGSLWKVPINGDPAISVTTPLVHISSPALSSKANRLAYVDVLRNISIWRAPINKQSGPEQFIASNFLDASADYSPDGTRIAFRSDRSGANEIWICRSDGKEPKRITNFDGPMTGSPRWSPDGHWLAFDSRVTGRADIYVIRVDGGTPVRVTNGASNNSDYVVPSWSRDGRSIYFSSNRSGEWQIWKKAVSGGSEEIQVTKHGGFNGMESPDGKSLYSTRNMEGNSIWRTSLDSGDETKVVEGLGSGMWGYWTVAKTGIFYLQEKSRIAAPADIFRLDPATGKTEKIGTTPFAINPGEKGIAVSPDGQWLLYVLRDVDRSSIMLVDGWE